MVEAILTAAARVLVRDGWDGATTNRIAEAAGISVGSLYQYFPSKEAIVAMLFERHAERMWSAFVSACEALWDRPLAEAVSGVIDGLWLAHQIEPRLHRVLHEQVPRIGRLGRQREMNRRARELVVRFLTAHADEVDVRDVETTAFVAVESVEALIHGSIEEPGIDPDRVRAEATALLLRYLPPSPQP
jgi:AcrR family transcriptional regulator